MKRLIITDNLANIAPIGNQYAEKQTSAPAELEVKFDKSDSTLKLNHNQSTIGWTDVNLIYTSGKMASTGNDQDWFATLFTTQGIKIYAMSIGVFMLSICGANPFSMTGFGGNYSGSVFPVGKTPGSRLSDPNSVSSLYSAFFSTEENLQVKVPNAFNRPLNFNNYPLQDRIAALMAYHNDCAAIAEVYDIISGLASWIYKANEIANIDVPANKGLYSPNLYPSMKVAFNKAKQLPVIEKHTFEAIQKFSKFYAANECNYYPGSYHVLRCGVHKSIWIGKASSVTNARLIFNVNSNIWQNLGTIGNINTYEDFRNVLLTASEETLINFFDNLNLCVQNIQTNYTDVIQLLIQANSKGLYKSFALGDFLDFESNGDQQGGIVIYEIEKDYRINNIVKHLPQTYQNEADTVLIVSPHTVPQSLTAQDIFTDYNRLVGPFELSDEMFDSEELLSMGVWFRHDPDAQSFDDIDAEYTDKVFGHGFYAGPVIIETSASTNGALSAPGSYGSYETQVDDDFLVNTAYDLHSRSFLGNGNSERAIKSVLCDMAISQFDLKYMVQTITKVTGIADHDGLHSGMWNDEYFTAIPFTPLENAAAEFNAMALDKVLWLYEAKSNKGESAGEIKDKK